MNWTRPTAALLFLMGVTHCSSDEGDDRINPVEEAGGSAALQNAGGSSSGGALDGSGASKESGDGGGSGASGGMSESSGGSRSGGGDRGTDGGGAGGGRTDAGGAAGSTGGQNASNGGSDDSGVGGASAGGTTSEMGAGGTGEDCVIDLDCDPQVLASSGDFGQDCVDRINQFRVGCHCLPPLERWTEGEACASANAEYDEGTGVAHSGWRSTPGACPEDTGPLSGDFYGWATNECPGWGSGNHVVEGCMKAMYYEGSAWADMIGRVPTESDVAACENDCYSANGHFIAMTKPSYQMVACGLNEAANGEVWSVQNFQ